MLGDSLILNQFFLDKRNAPAIKFLLVYYWVQNKTLATGKCIIIGQIFQQQWRGLIITKKGGEQNFRCHLFEKFVQRFLITVLV